MGRVLIDTHARRATEDPVIARFLARAYRKLGRRYPKAYLWLELQTGYFIAAGTASLLLFYIDTTAEKFLLFLAVAEGLTCLGLTMAMLHGSKMLRPIKAWIGGDRSPEKTIEAWTAGAELAVVYWRDHWYRPVLLNCVPVGIAMVIILDQPWATFFVGFGAALVALLYAAILHSFALELGMRPVMLDIASELPPTFRVERAAVPLRAKLLLAVPAITLITAMVVSGLTADDPGLGALGFDVLVAAGVTVTVALELAVLLSRTILFPVRDLLQATERVGTGDFGVKVPVTTSDELGQLGTAFNEMVAGLAERERIREAFGTYLDHEVAEHILNEGTALEGEEVEVSVLFCDVRDFTGLASEVEAREVVSRLNQLFECLVPIVAKHGGHVDKFVGDGLLAVFGAPQKHPDHADRAVAAACEMATSVARDRDLLRIGVGINSGRVVAGSMGGAGRLEFTVIGDAVNVAARVEAATRVTGDDVLITAATRDLLAKPVELEARPAVELKGKDGSVELYAPRVEVPALVAPDPAVA
jgi:adenylate cyclase